VAGVVRPLEKRLKLKGARIAVLGAGGAARAAVFGLVEQGAEVFIVNRTHEHAVKLAKESKAKALKHEQFAKSHFDVLINSTPCGMAGNKAAAAHRRE
jgi:3-dehydroquinate dehydratase/shikimate dehydrogenase